jgi:hypothetical protein
MEQTNIEKYAGVMTEIKLRTEVITLHLSGQLHSKYPASTIETIGLQFRKVFELIAFSSLAAHRELYSRVYSDFQKHWEAAKLLKNLRRMNSNFYPEPLIEVPSSIPGVKNDLRNRNHDYLTEGDLITAHGRCGSLLHAANPFGRGIDYNYYKQSFPEWLTKIINLLNCHKVHLPGDTDFYLFHMKEDGNG